MAKLVDILQQERERDTADKWGLIHLYKTGSFYSRHSESHGKPQHHARFAE